MNCAIILQGPTDKLQDALAHLNPADVIISTWKDENFLFNSGSWIATDEKPSIAGPCNLNYQKRSTLNGLRLAQKLGYTHAIKCRSDFQITNPEAIAFLSCEGGVKFIGWHHHEVYPNCPGYLMDFVMGGPIEDLIKLWDFNDNYFCQVPEIILTKRVIDLGLKVGYYWDDLKEDNELIWLKNGRRMSELKDIVQIEPHNKDKYSNTLEYLREDYLKFL